MDVREDILKIKKSLNEKALKNELKAYEMNKIPFDPVRVEKLKMELGQNDKQSDIENDELLPKDNNTMALFFDVLDDLVYKRPWIKLSEFHKKTKLKEYVNNMYTNPSDKKKFFSKISKAIKSNDKFLKKNIDYNPVTSQIISISFEKK